MHDVIRDIAVSIALSEDGQQFLVKTHCDLKHWPMDAHEGHTAISVMESNICKLPNKLVCSKLQILLLGRNYGIREIPKTFFQSPNDLSKTRISSLPPSCSLLTTLQSLHLHYCPRISDISILKKLKKLEILSMRECSVRKFPKEIANLTNLKMLDLTNTSLETVPSRVISRLHGLEELHMNWYVGNWGRKFKGGLLSSLFKNADFDELAVLKRLNTLMVSLSDAECLPQYVESNPNWVNFCICISKYGFRVPSDWNPSPRALIVESTMTNFPDWFISVVTKRTEDLWYIYCRGLTVNLVKEHDRVRLHGLKFLYIDSCFHTKVLMITITWPRVSDEPVFENLEELKIYKAELLEELCVGELPPGSLSNLKILNVRYCHRLVKSLLPSKLLDRLHGLEKLACADTDGMKYVFGFDGHEPQQLVLTKLRMISLRSVDHLRHIWNCPAPPGIFHSLKTFYLMYCGNLKYVFTSAVARCLLQLEDLWVESCLELDRLIEASEERKSNAIALPQLINIVLKDLPRLTRLSGTSSTTIDIKIECPSLEHLYVRKCHKVSISASDFNSRNRVRLKQPKSLYYFGII